ncbi:MAG: RNA methyltransferase [Firmicutes bacterium]|nr:RNA methyltransferase [Bacillota bacterium]
MITSLSNPLIKKTARLRQKKGRQEQRLYLAEGIHLASEAIKAGAPIRRFFWSSRLTATLEGELLLQELQRRFAGDEVSEAVLEKICETENPQGVAITIALPENPVWDPAGWRLGLIVDGLQDPGNVGTIIRTAWAAGVDGLLLTPGTADPYQGKAVRASQGGIFYQRIFQDLTPKQIMEQIGARAGQTRIQLVAGDPGAIQNLFEIDLQPPTIFLIGNEGNGWRPEWEKKFLKRVKIPQPGGAESLNVSVATGILVYEAIRQRLLVDTCKN